ncbi:MAG: hypothetical protein VKL39_20610 [Leptolyngbyaceae bacterium]|nr:hypothetical protein [Leptolyngbyaceae bacterium]
MSQNIAEISTKLVKVIKTRDAAKVRYVVDILERQKNAALALDLLAQIIQTLETTDQDLHHWFQDLYFEGCSPETKTLWLEFTRLSLALRKSKQAS